MINVVVFKAAFFQTAAYKCFSVAVQDKARQQHTRHISSLFIFKGLKRAFLYRPGLFTSTVASLKRQDRCCSMSGTEIVQKRAVWEAKEN